MLKIMQKFPLLHDAQLPVISTASRCLSVVLLLMVSIGVSIKWAQAESAALQLDQWQPRIIQDDDEVEMVIVPPGCFMMGSEDGNEDEQPIHEQCFTESFYIDRYEVTNGQFERISHTTPPSEWTGDNRPVDSISWFAARDYCAQRALEGQSLRLPTEREWEYAARGPESLLYPWGNDLVAANVVFDRTDTEGSGDVIDMNGNPARPEGASWVGALDMSGNVWEWTSTRYDDNTPDGLASVFPYPYTAEDGREDDETEDEFMARMNETGFITLRTFRGGSWAYPKTDLTSAARFPVGAIGWLGHGGFRCAASFQ